MVYFFTVKRTGITTESLLLLLFSSISAAITFFLYAPCAIYISNAEEFPFTLADFFYIPVLCFIFTTAILFAAGLLIKNGRTAYCAVLLAIGLLFYLQGSFLFEDTGVLNGMPYYAAEHRAHIIQNSIIWILSILISVFSALRFRKNAARILTAISGIFSAFIALSLAIVLLTAKSEYLKPREGFVSKRGLYEASRKCNVIVIVPDMFDKTYMSRIIESEPEIADEFSGFTFYSGVNGCYYSTKDSLSAFLADAKLQDAIHIGDFSSGIYTDSRFIPADLQAESVNCLSEKAHITNIPAFTVTLYRLAACAYAPDIFRESVWLYGSEFEGFYSPDSTYERIYTTSNSEFYNGLKEQGITLSDKPHFRFIHIYGAHYPYVMDDCLNPIVPSYSDINAVKAARGTLRIISVYLDRLKSAGAYDSSLIVIMADHGYTAPGVQADPLLMIRLPGSDSPFEVSDKTIIQNEIPEILSEKILGMISK